MQRGLAAQQHLAQELSEENKTLTEDYNRQVLQPLLPCMRSAREGLPCERACVGCNLQSAARWLLWLCKWSVCLDSTCCCMLCDQQAQNEL